MHSVHVYLLDLLECQLFFFFLKSEHTKYNLTGLLHCVYFILALFRECTHYPQCTAAVLTLRKMAMSSEQVFSSMNLLKQSLTHLIELTYFSGNFSDQNARLSVTVK